MRGNKTWKTYQSNLLLYRITVQILELSTTMKKEAEKQGEICFKIEQNLCTANENMENANRQLNRRAESHSVNNRLYFWFALFLMLSLLGVGTYVYVKYFREVTNTDETTAPIV
jgi:t-SNARE complex subunit (syntaxin)